MSRGKKKQKQIQAEIDRLELKRRNGLMRCVASIVIFTVLIIIKITLVNQGVEWANTSFANMAIFILAIVFAGICGMGSRAWVKAKNEIAELESKLR